MDAPRRLSLCCSLLLLFSPFLFPVLSSSSSSSSSVAADRSSDKVTLALYYETLCPYCSNLIVNYLYKVFENGLIDIIDLKLIPYGNAKISSNGTIVCQHGETECLLNTIEACAIHTWPDVYDHFQFVYCVEKLIYEDNYDHWETCFAELNLDPTPVLDCYNSGYGDKLELRYAAETNSLEPSHTYVPWLVVDGQPLYDDYRDFVRFVCKAYKGTKVPEACSGLSSHKKTLSVFQPVTYTEEKLQSIPFRIRSAVTSWIRQVAMAAST